MEPESIRQFATERPTLTNETAERYLPRIRRHAARIARRLPRHVQVGDLVSAGFVGLVGGIAEWVFIKPGIVSTTTSAANRYADLTADHLATTAWREVSAALDLTGPPPPWRVVREKRATFAATADQERRRPEAATGLSNLVLAGDWTRTGLPATIEGAIRSGETAAGVLLESRNTR